MIIKKLKHTHVQDCSLCVKYKSKSNLLLSKFWKNETKNRNMICWFYQWNFDLDFVFDKNVKWKRDIKTWKLVLFVLVVCINMKKKYTEGDVFKSGQNWPIRNVFNVRGENQWLFMIIQYKLTEQEKFLKT